MEDRNLRPEESSKLPLITLLVLFAFILALLFTGYEYFSDGPEVANKKELAPEMENTDEQKVSVKASKSEEGIKETVKKEVEKPIEPIKKLVAEIPANGELITHLVQSGETFFGIANRYNLKSDVLRALNPDVDPQKLQIGTTRLKIKIRAKHTVGPGDILSVVAKKYDISKKMLMDANKLDKDFSKRGDELIIPFK